MGQPPWRGRNAKGELREEPPAFSVGPVVAPCDESGQDGTDDRPYQPVSSSYSAMLKRPRSPSLVPSGGIATQAWPALTHGV